MIENLEGEIWRDVAGFEGLYQVSNLGRVKSLKFGKERILKPGTYNYGRKFVILCKNRDKLHKLVHRLVAQAFIPNPDKKPEVDHIDTNTSNNCVDNLRWVNHHENNQNPLSIIHQRDAKRTKMIPIYCYETDKIYESMIDVQRQLNVNAGSVSRCCTGKYSQTGGYHFCYASELSDTYELF